MDKVINITDIRSRGNTPEEQLMISKYEGNISRTIKGAKRAERHVFGDAIKATKKAPIMETLEEVKKEPAGFILIKKNKGV